MTKKNRYFPRQLTLCLILWGFVFGISSIAEGANLDNLSVRGILRGPGGATSEVDVTAYRWLVEEDRTYHVAFDGQGQPISIPTVAGFDSNWENTLSVSFHKSYMPVAAKGCVGFDDVVNPGFVCGDWNTALQPNKYYFVSVLPRKGYTIGGTAFKTNGAGVPFRDLNFNGQLDADGQDGVAGTPDDESRIIAYVHQTPLPTAQIVVSVFADTQPINGVADLPAEDPLTGGADMSGFKVNVEDAGGRYGASAGMMSTDVYGNPLGTTYKPGCDPYDPACVDVVGGGIFTGPDGYARIYNVAQGKYGITVVPPPGTDWVQTSTIEGTKVIDAWVKPNEPPFFAEFGPPGPHASFGFTRNFNSIPAGGTATLSGTIVNMHMSRPPDYAFYNGGCFGHTTPWVALNDLAVGIGTGIFAAPTDGNCNFTIPNVPDGNYQLTIFDNNLDLIIAFKGISIANGSCNTANGDCNLGQVPVFQWFSRQEHWVFNDANGNGEWDEGEDPLPDVPVSLRWRDGTLYQTNVTDMEGAYAFDQIFPFFAWQVAEVGFTRLQATGVTIVVDNGGPVNPNDPWGGGVLNPQNQTTPATGPGAEYATHRVETGPTLTQGFQGFIGQTSAFQWGKRHYPDGENGGITGIVFYDVTRDVNNPQYAAGQVWEPGIPGVTVNLYDSSGTILLNTTTTDSWDESIPTGCKYGDSGQPFIFSPDGIYQSERDCYDGLRNFNQVRPGVFDGGYAFNRICTEADGLAGGCATYSGQIPPGNYVVEVVPPPGYELTGWDDKNVDFGDSYTPPTPALLPPACVGAETAVPRHLSLYPDDQIEVLGWAQGMTRPLCDRKEVTVSTGANAAADFFLFTEVPIAAHGYGFILDDTQNEFDPNAPNFGEKYAPPFMPVAIRDWTGREIGRTYSDQYGVYNFLAPSTSTTNVPSPSGMSPNMLTTCMNDATRPGGLGDAQHNPIYSQFCYTFQYMPGVTTYLDTPVVPVGAFAGADQFPVDCEFPDKTPRISQVTVETNGVGGGPYIPVNSTTLTVTGNQTITIHSMGTVAVPDPTYCNNVNGNCPAGSNTTDKVVTRDYGFGPSGTVTLGNLGVLNCTWGEPISCSVPAGTYVGGALGGIGGRQLTVRRSDGSASRTGITVQLGLRPGARATQVSPDPTGNPLASPLQTAIDTAGRNDLLLVKPGIYNEMVVMWKPVQLQGYGEGSTTINALKQPAEKLTTWRGIVQNLIQTGRVALLPGQEAAFGGIEQTALMTEEGAGVLVLASASGANRFDQNNNRGARIDGFTVTGADTGGGIVVNGYGHYVEISNNRVANNSGTFGGGIRIGHPQLTNTLNGLSEYTDAQNDFVKIHNNQVKQNGSLDGAGAGISMCTGSDAYQVTGNWVCGNFSTQQGGGIGHIGRSDGLWVTIPSSGPQNRRVWTLTQVPLIEDNVVLFNEIFNQLLTVSGGGVFIGGAPAFGCPLLPNGQPDLVCLADPTRVLGPGAGNVEVNRNLIQGNGVGSGDGGGIRLAMVNGQDVAFNPGNTNKRPGNTGANDPAPWFKVDLSNNMVVNNVAGLAGGGISLQDAVRVNILHNTVANNYSLAVAGEAFSPGSPNQSTPQPGAGIVTRPHSTQLANLTPNIGTFSDPQLEDTIVWHNRKYFFFVDAGSNCQPGDTQCTSTFGLCPDPTGNLNCPADPNYQIFDDLAVIGQSGSGLTCDSGSCFTSADGDPLFVRPYLNGARSSVLQAETTTIQTPVAFDEGGNFIRPSYGPLTLLADPEGNPQLLWDYRIQAGSPAIDSGVNRNAVFPRLSLDFDSTARPKGTQVDIGAHEKE